jgi:hypothetical protein
MENLSPKALDRCCNTLFFVRVFLASVRVILVLIEARRPFESDGPNVWVDAIVFQKRNPMFISVRFSDLSTTVLVWSCCQHHFVFVKIYHFRRAKRSVTQHHVFDGKV